MTAIPPDLHRPLHELWQRCTAGIVLIAFGMLTLAPTAAVAREHGPELFGTATSANADESRFAFTLKRLTSRIERLTERLDSAVDETSEKAQIRAIKREFERLDRFVTANLARIDRQLADQGAPHTLHARNAEMQALYRMHYETLAAHLRAVIDAPNVASMRNAAASLQTFLHSFQQERTPAPFDPDALPFQPRQPKPGNHPRESSEAFGQSGLRDYAPLQFAALDDYRFDLLPGAVDPALLAETVEIRLTPSIHAKAAELGHDPVRIYHFVRNEFEWIPSWGAMQDAKLTLSARRGNSLDLSSLLISLLRASGIPARYAHGTIDVPEDRFRNWAGGFDSARAAADFASSGGIPATALTRGGRISHVRIEHVWVEAAIDYMPSRGAVMRSADTWTALDASFKQYDYLPGLDIAAIAGLDGQTLADAFVGSGTINESQGWVQGLDPAILAAAQDDAQAALEAHIEQMTDPSVGDVVGGRRAIVQEAPVLPSGLPFDRVVTGARYASLPSALRPTITFGFGRDILGDPLQQQSWPWARLNNRKVTLSFRPASEADETALLALLPDGEITDIGQLPSSIPSHLIRVVPELKVEGETVMSAPAMRLGEELAFSYTVKDPVYGTRRNHNNVVAGSYLAVGIAGGAIAPGSLSDVQSQLEATRGALESEDAALLASLTREDLLGDLFHAGMLGYFAQLQALGHLASLAQGNHFHLAPSVGTYGYVPEVTYFFGLPRSITPGGVEMDMDHLSIVSSAADKGTQAWSAFNFQLGALSSALEHAVPEQMFVTDEHPGEAVSAVNALQKAASLGQRVYHITPLNQATALPDIRHNALVMNEIRAALDVGREVIVHTDPVDVPGWTGAGYVIVDPDTGAGAWKIRGGANGGAFSEEGAAGFVKTASIMSLILDAKMAFTEGLVQKLAPEILKQLAKAFSRIALLSAFINIISNIIHFSAHCATEPALAFSMALTLLGVLGFAAVFFAGAVTGGLIGVAFSFIVGRLVSESLDFARTRLTNSGLCYK